ncbi:phosphoadenosine phosphosulfate reductase family protein [Aquimarina algiphila]|uniref:FAD synthetase n=2 Tax=Aquimarina algiphila TaxID=2047982 RepID=A0A554VE21_9FLAO|nr:phosphoadenosine phosphosulfate reductase family protein [Aquimarina algiphila]TSE05233.1 FAD synthetase [Aquimarina algiphila]
MKDYDKYIVAFSGGKDSIACFLNLLDQGIPKEKIELWHHLVDGANDILFDWEVTEDYCRQFAKHFGVEIFFSWKEGGFRKEMNRQDSLTSPTHFEVPFTEYDNETDYLTNDFDYPIRKVGGTRGKKSTRRKFPQIGADLKTRWCSAYLKIDICATAIRNQKRFNGKSTLLISGERGEESAARAKYNVLESDRADLRNGKCQRLVDRARPIRDWKENQVWEIIERYGVVVHPCYYLGFSRCSCKFCIFGNADQFKTAFYISPNEGKQLIAYENNFGYTMKRSETLEQFIEKGEVYNSVNNVNKVWATSKIYLGAIITKNWVLPSGAYGESCGPS